MYMAPLEVAEDKISAVWASGRILGNNQHTTCILVDGVEFEVVNDMEDVMISIETAKLNKRSSA